MSGGGRLVAAASFLRLLALGQNFRGAVLVAVSAFRLASMGYPLRGPIRGAMPVAVSAIRLDSIMIARGPNLSK